jgi:hypothetical protein
MELGRLPGVGTNCWPKLTGHLVERRDLRVIRQMEDLTDDELEVLAGADRQQQAGDGSVH